MVEGHLIISQSEPLQGTIELTGAKNAVLVIMASLILTEGKSLLTNVPLSDDVTNMITLLRNLGADITVLEHGRSLAIDTRPIKCWHVDAAIMKKMRASVLVMGPLLARFGKAEIAVPGGCVIGSRPIDYHLAAFRRMGATISLEGDCVCAETKKLTATTVIFEYPSVGATENVLMAAIKTPGVTKILNAALEPEVTDLINALRSMGAKITIEPPATIRVEGVADLKPIHHAVMYDRLEAGSIMLAAAITGGTVTIPQAPAFVMDLVLMKLEEMGHTIIVGPDGQGITLKATRAPKAVSFKTAPYPGFPTDLQAPMSALQCIASGTSHVQETVFENRLLHMQELQKMGAHIRVNHNIATIEGVEHLSGSSVVATDIRASCALIIAGLVASGETKMAGIHHVLRGYDRLPEKLASLGARIAYDHGPVLTPWSPAHMPTAHAQL